MLAKESNLFSFEVKKLRKKGEVLTRKALTEVSIKEIVVLKPQWTKLFSKMFVDFLAACFNNIRYTE